MRLHFSMRIRTTSSTCSSCSWVPTRIRSDSRYPSWISSMCHS